MDDHLVWHPAVNRIEGRPTGLVWRIGPSGKRECWDPTFCTWIQLDLHVMSYDSWTTYEATWAEPHS